MPANYNPSQFPAFAVTVDIVILTILEQNVTIGSVGNQPKKSVRQNEIATSSGQIQSGRDTITYTVTGDLRIYRPVARSP